MIRGIAILLVGSALATACATGDDSDATSSSSSSSSVPPVTTAETSTNPSTTTTTLSPPTTDVEVATINLLHGIPGVSGCSPDSDFCLAPTRIDILWDLLDSQAGCPEIIALQEISPRQQELVPQKLGELCDGEHVLLVDDVGSPEQEMILTTLAVVDERRVELAGAPVWSAHWAQLETEAGALVDVFATHYASSALDIPCDPAEPISTCSEACPADSRLGDCHPFETLEFLAANGAPGSLQLVIGDLNEEIDGERIQTLIEAGFVDTHLAADNEECDPATGIGCSSGIGGDTDLDGLDLADQHLGSRIDFVLVRPPEGCTLLVDADDADSDGTSTGLWANEPLPEAIEGLFWAADHTGVQADVGLACS